MSNFSQSTRARKRRSSVLSSSDSEREGKCSIDKTQGKRLSSRLMLKRKKPSFVLPSRDAIWNTIPSLKSPEKLKLISPRKSVSNFTKIYNSYNFDDYDNSSVDGDTDDSVSSSNSSSDHSVETPKRVKNFHRRIRAASSSSDEEEPTSRASEENNKSSPHEAAQSCSTTLSNSRTTPCSQHKTCTDETESKIPPIKESGSDDSEEDTLSSNPRRISRHSLLDSDSDGGASNKSSSSCDDNKSESNTEDVDHQQSCSGNRASNLRQKKKDLFSNFKDTVSKRKAKQHAIESPADT